MDPSAFMANAGQFNPAQFQNNPQQMAAMANGPMRNASPTFQNSMYQTNSVVPAKRQRPREDSLAGSPRPNPGMLPTSRSETPQQFPGFQPQQQPQQQNQQQNTQQQQQQHAGQPGQYPHLQPNGSANATPSPMMPNQQLRSGSVPQRVSTASPHPFSPSAQQFAPQASPVPSEHGTPQPNHFMQNIAPGFNPNMGMQTPTRPSPNSNQMAGGQMMAQQPGQQMGQMGQMGMGQMGQMPMGMTMGQPMTPQQMQHLQQQMGQMPNQMFPPQMQQAMQQARTPAEQQKLYQMQLHQRQMQQQQQAQQQQGSPQNMQQMQQMQEQLMAQMRQQNINQQGMMGNMMPKQPIQMQNGQQMAPNMMRPQRQPPRMDPVSFMKNLTSLMNAKGLPLETQPTIGDRSVNLMQLFQQVTARGGSRPVTASNTWPHVCMALQISLQQFPQAPQLMKGIYERNLQKMEEAWHAQQNQRKMMQHQHQQQQQQQQGQQQGQQQLQQGQQQQGPQQGQQPPQQQPSQQPQAQAQQPPLQNQQPQGPQQPNAQRPPTPAKQQPVAIQQAPQPGQMMPAPGGQKGMQQAQQPAVNGMPTPHGPQIIQANAAPHGHRNSISRSTPTPGLGGDFPMPSPAMAKAGAMSLPSPAPGQAGPAGPAVAAAAADQRFPRMPQTDEYNPCSRQATSYGGVELMHASRLGEQLLGARPDVPPVHELGFIDIHALTRSLQSGIYGEVRLALDTLASVSNSWVREHQIILAHCEDLVDALIDCAEEQVDLLAEHTVEVSDEIQLITYEDVARACRNEAMTIQDIPEFGSTDYQLDRAVDRLICVTTILRNLSFPGEEWDNFTDLADEPVIKFLCVVIRYLGTRTMLLRTNRNTLDFMKDTVIFLSNVASAVEIPSREQAQCLLQFLLAFAPSPSPSLASESLYFPSYEPILHPYLSHAVDALAKLLARDEPNRTHYRTLFALDATSSTPYDLLTKSFSLAVAPVPDVERDRRSPQLPPLVETRKPFLMQGLLAAEIITSLAPGYDSHVVRTWLAASNGLAQKIYRMIQMLSQMFDNPPRLGGRGQPRKDESLLYLVHLGVNLLKRLVEKSWDPADPTSIPPAVLPSRESAFGAVVSLKSTEWSKEGIIKQLEGFGTLDI